MKFSELRLFLDIVDAGSLTQAARKRGISQPNLSRALRNIETKVNSRLLRRDGRGVEPTLAGQLFLVFAQEVLSGYDALRSDLREFEDGLPRTISIALPMRTEHILLPALLRAFAETQPGMTVHAAERFSEDALDDMADHRIDAMIGYVEPPAGLSTEVLAVEVFYAVGSQTHLGQGSDPIRMNDVLDLPLIVAGPDRYLSQLKAAAASCGRDLPAARYCSAADAMVAFAAEGEGVAILPLSNFEREARRKEVRYRPIIEPVIERKMYLGLQSGLTQPALQAIRGTIHRAIASIADRAGWADCKLPREQADWEHDVHPDPDSSEESA